MHVETLAARFMQLFAGLERAHGVYNASKRTTEGEKVKGRAVTEKSPVTEALWAAHLEGKVGIGIIPIRDDGTVSWSVIDVDVYNLNLVELEKKLVDLKLPLVLVRSKSGGAHLFLFCAEPLSAKYVRGKLTEWAVLLGYPGVEIFPKQNELASNGKDVGNWLNMPYYNVVDTTRYGIYNGAPLSASDFVEFAESRRVTKSALDNFIVSGLELFDDGPPCLQTLAKGGFPRGTRNKGLFNLGVFARLKFGDDWQDRVDSFNRVYMQPPLSTGEVMSTMKSLSRKAYFYTCTQDPVASVCNKDICRHRKYGVGNNDVAVPPVQLGAITKINSDPPTYTVDVEGVRIDCTAEDLLQQNKFRKLVFERANKVMPLLKGGIWDAMLAEKLVMLKEEDAPADSGPEGQFLAHLEAFCTSRVTANTLDEVLLGKPYVDTENNETIFRSTDLIKYLTQQGFREFTERKIWSVLKRAGARHHQYMLKGKCVTAWIVPAFRQQNEPFAVPKVEGSDI